MDRTDIETSLRAAEAATASGEGLKGTSFWKAVAAVKSSPELIEDFADQIGAIDRRAFENWATLVIPIGLGTSLAMMALALGVAGLVLAFSLSDPWSWISFGAGTAVLIVTTHGLGHLVTGTLQGMRFTHWFIGTIGRPQPGIKVDYATYLRTPARQRAWMHASGALVTKVTPFLMVPLALAAGLPWWVTWGLVALGTLMAIADAAWSVKASDWKKFRREMRYV
ncbi:hypothetical protein BH23ACT5_BH23ACT5_10380 [soil metagenome]